MLLSTNRQNEKYNYNKTQSVNKENFTIRVLFSLLIQTYISIQIKKTFLTYVGNVFFFL